MAAAAAADDDDDAARCFGGSCTPASRSAAKTANAQELCKASVGTQLRCLLHSRFPPYPSVHSVTLSLLLCVFLLFRLSVINLHL